MGPRAVMYTRVGSVACASAAALVELGWLVGRLASDRTRLTQWLSWIPAPLACVVIIGLIGVSWALARFGRRGRAPATRLRLVVGAICLIALGMVAVTDWRMLSSTPSGARAARIVFWNASGADLSPMSERLARETPDILVMANPNRRRWAFDIASAIGSAEGGSAHVAFGVQLSCISRDSILAWGATDLGLHGRISRKAWITADEEPKEGGIDRGRAMYVVIDATRWLGRPMVVWIVDLPSDAGLARPAMMEHARRAIDEFSGQEYRAGEDGRWIASPVEGGFPPADVLVGDLNTPRGSASIRRLVGDLRDAWETGGRGWLATWPRRAPLWHIDQTFLGVGIECVAYRAIDLGRSEHRAIAIDVAVQRGPNPR